MDPTDCPPDEGDALERVHYFDGMLLGAKDFEQEQTYFRSTLRRHNRLLHGWGVVTGLEVTSVGPGNAQVSVSPGYALDPCGNEIIIEATVTVDVPKGDGLLLAARFDERVVSEGRVRDSFALRLLTEPGEPWIGLAKVSLDDQGAVAIDCSLRRGLSLD
jgi:hypothetical protein